MRDQPRGRGDDGARAAVVRLQRDALERGVELVEEDDPLDARAPKRVQRLVFVADAEQLVVRRGDDPHEQLLGGLDVLVLVDEHALPAPLPARADVRALAQQPQRSRDEVVEIQPVGFALQLLVGGVQRGERVPFAVGVGRRRGGVLLGRLQQPELDVREPAFASPGSSQTPSSPAARLACAASSRHWASVGPSTWSRSALASSRTRQPSP